MGSSPICGSCMDNDTVTLGIWFTIVAIVVFIVMVATQCCAPTNVLFIGWFGFIVVTWWWLWING